MRHPHLVSPKRATEIARQACEEAGLVPSPDLSLSMHGCDDEKGVVTKTLWGVKEKGNPDGPEYSVTVVLKGKEGKVISFTKKKRGED
jgi:hypothetical protein